MRRMAVAVLALALALPARASGVKLGVVRSATGAPVEASDALASGVRLAREDLARRGIEVELVWEDDGGRPEVGLAAVQRLAARRDVAGVIGSSCSSEVSRAAAKAAERWEVPLVVPCATSGELTRLRLAWTFRVSATTDDDAKSLLDAALSAGRPRTIVILNEDTEDARAGSRSAYGYAKREDVEILLRETYGPGAAALRAALERARDLDPDLVLIVSAAGPAEPLRLAREAGLAPRGFLFAGGALGAVDGGELGVGPGVLASTPWVPGAGWQGAAGFAARYRRAYGVAPRPEAAAGYASTMVLGEEAAKAGGDRERLRQALRAGTWDGVEGPIRFRDYDGYLQQNEHPVLVQQVQSGRAVTVWPRPLAAAAPAWPFPGWR